MNAVDSGSSFAPTPVSQEMSVESSVEPPKKWVANTGEDAQTTEIDMRETTVIQGVDITDKRIQGPTKSEGGSGKRNTFACVSCHSSKVKCIPSNLDDIYRKPCQRCLKNQKICTFDLSKRTKRRKQKVPTATSSLGTMTATFSQVKNNTYPLGQKMENINYGNGKIDAENSISQESNNINSYSFSTPTNGRQDPLEISNAQNLNYFWPSSKESNASGPTVSSIFMPTSNDNVMNNTSPRDMNFSNGSQTILRNSQSSVDLRQHMNMGSSLPNNDIYLKNMNFNNRENSSPVLSGTNNGKNNHFPISNYPHSQSTLQLNSNMFSDVNDNSTSDYLTKINLHNGSIRQTIPNEKNIILRKSSVPNIESGLSMSAYHNSNNNHNRIMTTDQVLPNRFNSSQYNHQPQVMLKSHSNVINKKQRHQSELSKADERKLKKQKLNDRQKAKSKKRMYNVLIHYKDQLSVVSKKLNDLAEQWNTRLEQYNYKPNILDPITAGIISLEEAEERLAIYKNDVSYESKFPFIKISKSSTVKFLRERKPIFFSVIMASVSILMTPDQTSMDKVMELNAFILRLLGEQVFRNQDRSVEMLEALLTWCMWYNIPDWANKTHYDIFNHVCSCLSRDISNTHINESFKMFSNEDNLRVGQSESIKSQYHASDNSPRLTLMTYITSLNISIFLKQSLQIRWSNLIAESCSSVLSEIATNSPIYRIEDDEILVVFIKLNHLLEKIHTHLHDVDQSIERDDDPEYAERHFNNLITKYKFQLDEIFEQIPKERSKVLAYYYSVEAYLYQYILGSFVEKIPDSVSKYPIPTLIHNAFLRGQECCIACLEQFLKIKPKNVASLPLFHTSRIVYTIGMLLLKIRYSTVAIASFHYLKPLTENTLDIVSRISELLESSSKLYPFNHFLYKFEYVIALFVQTYANLVTSIPEENLPKNEKLKHPLRKRETNQMGVELDTKNINNGSSSTGLLPSANFENQNNGNREIQAPYMEQEQRALAIDNIGNNNNNILDYNKDPHNTNGMNVLNVHIGDNIVGSSPSNTNMTDLDPSPADSSMNINDYLTDIDSLMFGFNNLNDEFWGDVIGNQK